MLSFHGGGGVSIRGLCFLSMYLLEKPMWVSSLKSICHFCSTNKPRTNHTQRSKVFYDAHARRAAQSQELLNTRTNTLQAAQTRKDRQTSLQREGSLEGFSSPSPLCVRAFLLSCPFSCSVCEPFFSLVPSLARSLKTPAPGIAPSRRGQNVCPPDLRPQATKSIYILSRLVHGRPRSTFSPFTN